MFGTRISLPFPDLFRIRKRRAATTDDVARASHSVSSPRSNMHRLISSLPKPFSTPPTPFPRRRSFLSSLPSTIVEAPLSESSPAYPSPLPPIIIIERDPLNVAAVPPSDASSHVRIDGTSHPASPLAPITHRVSFQLLEEDGDEDGETDGARTLTLLSVCSSILAGTGEGAIESPVSPAFNARGRLAPCNLPVVRLNSGRCPFSHPKPTCSRPRMRASFPSPSRQQRTMTGGADDAAYRSERFGVDWEGKKAAWWSRELSKPETLEVPSAL